MASTTVPQAAARLRRIDLRVVVGLAVLLVGVAGTLGVVQRAGARSPVLVVARDVPAGQVIGEWDVRAAELGIAPGVATLGVGERGRVVGRVASVPLAAGQVLSPSSVADSLPLGAGQALMSVAVAPEHAAAGMLQPGDRVAVVASGKPGQPEIRAQVLLSPVQVLSVVASPDEAGAERKLLVGLAVRPEQAAVLAQAAQGTVDLVLLSRGGGR
jgi:Flp pilus assembly protein CpaB